MKKYIFLGLIIASCLTYLALPAQYHIKIHKLFYTKYARIFNSKIEDRFSRDQLLAAIDHAKQQPWVLDQIRSDLAPFKDGIDPIQLKQWYMQLDTHENRLAYFKIHNGIVEASVNNEEIRDLRSFKTVNTVFSILAKEQLVPDCEFVVIINDYLIEIPDGFTTPVPFFTFAKSLERPVESTTILIPDWMNLYNWHVLKGRIDYASKVFPWQNKISKIHWRGGCADSMGHRHKLAAMNEHYDFLDVRLTEGANPAPLVDPGQSLEYKYQISLDGARCTWERMVWQMQSNSVMIKPASPQIQWFHRGLVPFVHYVPVDNVDAQNINNLYTWLVEHDQEVQEITKNANIFTEDNFNTEDLVAYYALLLQEYASLMG